MSLFFQASQAWMEWLMKKRKAFDQRGDMAIAAWAEQQQREMNLRVRRLSRSKVINALYSAGCYFNSHTASELYLNVNYAHTLRDSQKIAVTFWVPEYC